jgi:hypothetical protein
VFAAADTEGDRVEDDVIAAGNADVVHDEEVGLAGVGQGGIIISKCVISKSEVGRLEIAAPRYD